MDFTADELFGGRRFRLLTIVDDFARKSLVVEVGQHLTSGDVAAVLDRICCMRSRPERIRVDSTTGSPSNLNTHGTVEFLAAGALANWLETAS